MVPYIGGYQSYLDAQEAKAEAMADMKQPAAAKPKDTRVRVQTQLKFSYKEQRDFDTIENRVAELEEKLAQLEKEIAANASDYTKSDGIDGHAGETRRNSTKPRSAGCFAGKVGADSGTEG